MGKINILEFPGGDTWAGGFQKILDVVDSPDCTQEDKDEALDVFIRLARRYVHQYGHGRRR